MILYQYELDLILSLWKHNVLITSFWSGLSIKNPIIPHATTPQIGEPDFQLFSVMILPFLIQMSVKRMMSEHRVGNLDYFPPQSFDFYASHICDNELILNAKLSHASIYL